MPTFACKNSLRTLSVLWFAALITAACATLPVGTVVNVFDAQQSVDRYITSGRYDADFATVVAEASAWVEERALRDATETNLREQGFEWEERFPEHVGVTSGARLRIRWIDRALAGGMK